MIRVLIADDHAVVRRGLRQILSEVDDMEVGAEAANAQDVLDMVSKRHWDVVVLDITMPGRSGLDVLKDLKHLHPKLPVLILSVHAEEQYAIRVLKGGASGYLTKESAPEKLVEAIRKVHAGGKYVSASVAEKLASALDKNTEKLPHERLSDREYEVLCKLASGCTVTDVAGDLSLSVKTISTHRAHILEKMGMKSNAELIRYVFEHRLNS
jgi:DNA-binding NarL/FixJ family response regulator